MNLLVALGLTLKIEGTIAAVWFRSRSVVIPVLLVSMVTNPPLNVLVSFIGPRLILRGIFIPAQIVLELIVVIVEAVLLHMMLDWNGNRSFCVSFVLNAASYLTGLVLSAII